MGKFFVADVAGDAQIDLGTRIDELTKHSVYDADGATLETLDNSVDAMVFSNGTGLFLDADTRLRVTKFQQEPFVPNRTDMEREPSVSRTLAYLFHGTVAISASVLAPGSLMRYKTALGGANIRSGQVVIQSKGERTVISVLGGASIVFPASVQTSDDLLHAGQQIVFTPDPNGGPPLMTIQEIPTGELDALEHLVEMASAARHTVYFEMRGGGSGSNSGAITAFDGDDGGTPSSPTGPGTDEIVAIPLALSNVPVQFEVSPASLTSRPSGG